MIQKFIDRFNSKKDWVESQFKEKHPDSYKDIVKIVIQTLTGTSDYCPDPERIHCVDDGNYQGTLLFVIGAEGYQPDNYWFVKVGYGSCSGCDTLQAIHHYSDEPPNDEQVKDYMTLALHVVQGLKSMNN